MSTRLNWRLLLGEFVVIVVGVLMALWVDQLREARVNAKLEVEYLKSLVTDLEADLSRFDTTEEWMRRQEAAAATVLALYEGPDQGPGSAQSHRRLLQDGGGDQHTARGHARSDLGPV